MKNLHLITTSGKNAYFYNKSHRYLGLIPAEMYTLISQDAGNQSDPSVGADAASPSYYERKVAYWKAHGLLEETPWEHQMCEISGDDVKSALAGTLQVTFEVTDGCNLKCKYCGFGEMYQDYDAREGKRIREKDAVALLRSLYRLWELPAYAAHRKVNIGFYGGEPLLNMPFIEHIVEFLETHPCASRTFDYSMTTNALLLDRYMDFLATHEFHLLISLDGDAENSVYRVGEKGGSLFDKIIRNVDLLQREYPAYFSRRVRFNAVLHDKNSVEDTYRFIKTRYGKTPRISTLNPTGVRPEKQTEFNTMYKSMLLSLERAANRKEIVHDMFPESPGFLNVFRFLTQMVPLRYTDYNALFYENGEVVPRYPTGTCIPFARKLFMSVNGKLLPCEKVGHSYAVGRVEGEQVNLSFEEVAHTYTKRLEGMLEKCKRCYRLEFCATCLFDLYTGSDERPVCTDFLDEKGFSKELSSKVDYLEKHGWEYGRLNRVKIT